MEFWIRIFVSLFSIWAFVGSQRMSHKKMDPEEYCSKRQENELFREKVPEDFTEKQSHRMCGFFYRCTPGRGGEKFITRFKCQSGMSFDVDRQICDMRRRVDNCLFHEKKPVARPVWPIPEGNVSNCELPSEIECGTGECISKELFCDDFEDCLDGSDENICTPEFDPNAAPRCDPKACVLAEGCFCSTDGTGIPGGFTPDQTPQMIQVSFSGAVNQKNYNIVTDLFDKAINKGNGCTAKATFFVSHPFTNYSAVQELHRRGHEIAVNSISNKKDPEYWRFELDSEGYRAEFDDGRLIIEEFANMDNTEILGMRMPGGRVGGNRQFKMMEDMGFSYDASIAAPRTPVPIWPYTLRYKVPHKCIGIDQQCPSQSFPALWSMPLNELDRRDDFQFDEPLTGCHLVDSCSNVIYEKQFKNFLDNNLAHHYNTNRAPFGLHFSSSYFESHPKLVKVFKEWIQTTASSGNYYFVTMQETIHWMFNPTEVAGIANFEEWKTKCTVEGQAACSLPNPCSNRVPRLFPQEDSMFLYTCSACPREYPWMNDPRGDGFDDYDFIKK